MNTTNPLQMSARHIFNWTVEDMLLAYFLSIHLVKYYLIPTSLAQTKQNVK